MLDFYLTYFASTSIFIGIIIGIILLIRNRQNSPEFLLAFIMFLMSLILILFITNTVNPNNLELYGILHLFIPILFFFYTVNLLRKKIIKPLLFTLYFIPPMITMIINSNNHDSGIFIVIWYELIVGFFLLVIQTVMVRKYYQVSGKVKDPRVFYQWTLLFIIFQWFYYILLSYFLLGNFMNYFSVLNFTLSLLVLGVGIGLLFHPIVLYKFTLGTPKIEPSTFEKYQNSGLADTDKIIMAQKISDYMMVEKPYLKQDITLNELSILLSINPKYLSQVINEKFNKNFTEFINGYRIEEAKNFFHQDRLKYITIVGIAEESGFNSKSAFYNAFKKVTGSSPTAYLERMAG